MHGWQTLSHGSHTCWFDEQLFPDFSIEAFDPAYWQAQDAVTGQSRGRGVTWFVRHCGLSLVLRHYWRGGLMGKINPDRFWFHGVESSRAMAEFRLLGQLRELGLPVPRPVAARLQRQGLWYRADLLIEQIVGEISDEFDHDEEGSNIVADGEGRWRVKAITPALAAA